MTSAGLAVELLRYITRIAPGAHARGREFIYAAIGHRRGQVDAERVILNYAP